MGESYHEADRGSGDGSITGKLRCVDRLGDVVDPSSRGFDLHAGVQFSPACSHYSDHAWEMALVSTSGRLTSLVTGAFKSLTHNSMPYPLTLGPRSEQSGTSAGSPPCPAPSRTNDMRTSSPCIQLSSHLSYRKGLSTSGYGAAVASPSAPSTVTFKIWRVLRTRLRSSNAAISSGNAEFR